MLVNIDSGGARNNVVDAAIAKSAASTKCAPENYVISATHSHSASTGGLGGEAFQMDCSYRGNRIGG